MYDRNLVSVKYIPSIQFNEDQFRDICKLQDIANNSMYGSMCGEQWFKKSVKELPYYRATMVECCEAISEMGYKWWKKETCNLDSVKMELIDLLHFVVSDEIRVNFGVDNAVTRYIHDSNAKVPAVMYSIGRFSGSTLFEFTCNREELLSIGELREAFTFNDLCEQLAFRTLLYGWSDILQLFPLFDWIGMSAQEVYNMYCAKNVLNHFRNDKGQKTGDYMRMWDGVEDNEVLNNFIKDNPNTNIDNIYSYLEQKYADVTLTADTGKM